MTKKPNILLSCMTALIVCLVPAHAATDAAPFVAPEAGAVPTPLAARAETAADVAAVADASAALTAVADVAEQTLTLNVLEQEYGTVTGADMGANSITKDTSVTLTAAAATNGRFYGWVQDSVYLGTSATLTTTVTADTSIQAVFGAKDEYALRKNGTFYTDAQTSLTEILSSASENDVVEVLKSAVIDTNVTVPAGVTLYVPFREAYETDENGIVAHICGGASNLTSASPYVTLTISNGVTLTVNGTLLTGGVNSASNHSYQGHTSGAYGALVNNGTIDVNGTLNLWGYVTGSGEVAVNDGAAMYEPFIVTDYSGGAITTDLFLNNQIPFKRYAMQNVQCTLRINAGGSLYAHCNLYAGSGYNETDAPFMTPDDSLFRTTDGTTAVRTLDSTVALSGTTANGTTGISRATWNITGGLTFKSLTMNILGMAVGTEDMDFPIPYNFMFDLQDGVYDIPGRLMILPGAEMHVAEDAELDVSGWCYVYDGLRQSAVASGKWYPTSEELQTDGFSSAATFTVDGTLNVSGATYNNTPARFGGIVQSGARTGKIVIANDVNISDTVEGGKALNDTEDNRYTLYLPARANVDGQLAELKTGKTYYAWGDNAFTLESYTISWKPGADQDWNNETVTVNQPMAGIWSLSAPSDVSAEVSHVTYYSADDHNRTHTASLTESGSTLLLEVAQDDPAYVFQVSYKTGDEDVIVTAGDDGIYVIPATAESITVTSVILGDVSLDGTIAINDALLVQRRVSSVNSTLNELQLLAANYIDDGVIAINDALMIQKKVATS